ncbi:hypothetical protein ACHAXH_001136 [Discostella pseudostelligera]
MELSKSYLDFRPGRNGLLLLLLMIVASTSSARSLPMTMPPNPNSYVETNEDGSVTPPLYLLGNGEIEVTEEGYTVSKIHGNYVYMEFDPTTGTMVSSGLVAGKDDPTTATSETSGMMLTTNEHMKLPVNNDEQTQESIMISGTEDINGVVPYGQSAQVWRGVKKNLMIPMKFANHVTRNVPTSAELTILMNNVGPHALLCPTGSVRDVFRVSSYNQLDLVTTVAPWVTLSETEAYYANGDRGLTAKTHEMIKEALDALQATGFNFDEFDSDNDGFIDAIGFFHSGYGAEWGGTSADGANFKDRMFSHAWTLFSLPGGKWTSTRGKSVVNYHISPSLWGTSGNAIGRIGVIAHETIHFFGMPDLYDGSGGEGIGSYCLAANSWGFDGSQYYPPHLSAWGKVKMGWMNPIVISSSGSYSAGRSCEFPDIFLIDRIFDTGEYLLIENRQRCKFDAIIPGPGLAIFHIDDSADFTTEGYPGQIGWPTNGNHYRVALLQADGNYHLEKGISRGGNRGDATDLFSIATETGISNSGLLTGLLHPNTKGYKGGIIRDTGITISSISVSGDIMTFNVDFAMAKPTTKPTKKSKQSKKPVKVKSRSTRHHAVSPDLFN